MRGHFECQWFGVELPIINLNGQFMLEQRCLKEKKIKTVCEMYKIPKVVQKKYKNQTLDAWFQQKQIHFWPFDDWFMSNKPHHQT